MVKVDSSVLEAISDVREKFLKLTGSNSSLIVEDEGVTIEAYFDVPRKEMGEEPSAERQKKFEKLVRAMAIDYLFSGKARRIIIETERDSGKLLIEFRPSRNILKS